MHLRSILKSHRFLKREYLLKAGRICQNIWFIEKGMIGCFYQRKDKVLCSWFLREGDVVTAVRSFFDQVAGYESIQALEDTTVHYITFAELKWIYNHFQEFNYHGRELIQLYYKLSEERLYLLHSQKTVEKYTFDIIKFARPIRPISAFRRATIIYYI